MSDEHEPTIAVLMTCFNRREKTLCCLEQLVTQRGAGAFAMTVVLVDDASTDGTAEAVRTRFPEVELLAGDGNLFWNRGMRVAFGWALQRRFDFYLWLNDDTLLHPDALSRMLLTSRTMTSQGIDAIVTGTTEDASSGKRTYGGLRWKRAWRRELAAVQPDSALPLPCDTMNGNCTLIPARIAHTVGNLDPRFHHSFGDLDYGFRARVAGFAVVVAPGFVGTCSDNPRSGTWRDRSLSLRTRWRHLQSAKGSPFGEWQMYCHRHLGWLWPLYAVSPYVKTVVTSLSMRSGRARATS